MSGRDGWHSDQGGGIEEHPDVVVFRWEAPLFFANSGLFAEQVRELVQERQPGWVVLQCEAITDIDVTAAGMLERLDNELNAKGVHLAFVELRTRLRDLVQDYGLLKPSTATTSTARSRKPSPTSARPSAKGSLAVR